MPRPIEALIHTDALAHNLARARQAAPDARVWAVVKANAYGHGIERAFAGLRGADGFALLDLDEAERLRALDWRGPILLLEGCFEPRDLELCSRLNLWHVVHHDAQIEWLAAHKTQAPHRVFLKMNSGMNRLGFTPQAFRCGLGAAERAAAGGRDLADDALCRCRRRARHRPAGGRLRSRQPRPAGRALAEQQRGHAAPCRGGRRGRRLGARRHHGLRQRARLPAARHRPLAAAPGDDAALAPDRACRRCSAATASATAAASRPTRRCASAWWPAAMPTATRAPCATGTPVLVDGVRTRTVGRVSMDMITVDLKPVPAAGLGSEVTLWGEGPSGACCRSTRWRAAAGTIGYELMCALARACRCRVTLTHAYRAHLASTQRQPAWASSARSSSA